ncbi:MULTISPECIES: hypothetical protein [Streptomyces]|uniref:Uncharacterized protein n=1 Tax=Streptomyces spororaveus TaxID=284039 RepID=A0ABQ3TFA5_9ACTN|nr:MULTISPECIES: hypothetical protein [Streptomyces]MCM9080967.1 hypothetical protein [Streptomyces spororaveus]MCX5304586.1 hypothetical protein [Streptomyces sp. NBC_00160]GHI78645.1 hypothetical protein Sspor_42060 [Streptomyces spororaveus]
MPGPDGWEPLDEDVRRTLQLLLAGDSDDERRFRAQIPHTVMRASDCACPCVYLSVDTDAVPAVATERRTAVVAGAALCDADGGYDGEVSLFAVDGALADLQFCDWEDKGPGGRRLWEWLGYVYPG